MAPAGTGHWCGALPDTLSFQNVWDSQGDWHRELELLAWSSAPRGALLQLPCHILRPPHSGHLGLTFGTEGLVPSLPLPCLPPSLLCCAPSCLRAQSTPFMEASLTTG